MLISDTELDVADESITACHPECVFKEHHRLTRRQQVETTKLRQSLQLSGFVFLVRRQWQTCLDSPVIVLGSQTQQRVEGRSHRQRVRGSAFGFDARCRCGGLFAVELQSIDIASVEEPLRQLCRRTPGKGDCIAKFDHRDGTDIGVVACLDLGCELDQRACDQLLRSNQFAARSAFAWREIKNVGEVLCEPQRHLCAAGTTVQPSEREERVADPRRVVDLGLGDPEPGILL